MEKKLPIIIQSIIYRIRHDEPEFLLLRRSQERGDFWNAVNGTMEMNENVEQCQAREIKEETGIEDLLFRSDELFRFNFTYKIIPMTVIVFLAQVSDNQKVLINYEHTEYGWFNYSTALEMLKFDDDKNSLKSCFKFLQSK